MQVFGQAPDRAGTRPFRINSPLSAQPLNQVLHLISFLCRREHIRQFAQQQLIQVRASSLSIISAESPALAAGNSCRSILFGGCTWPFARRANHICLADLSPMPTSDCVRSVANSRSRCDAVCLHVFLAPRSYLGSWPIQSEKVCRL